DYDPPATLLTLFATGSSQVRLVARLVASAGTMPGQCCTPVAPTATSHITIDLTELRIHQTLLGISPLTPF
ncbi:hypothetical protein J6590_095239, partial [Homalodisca vitripennis]